MHIAIPYEEGKVCGQIERVRLVQVYHVDNGEIQSGQIKGCESDLVTFCEQESVDAVICYRMSQEIMRRMKDAHIAVFRGIEGDCESAVLALMNGQLGFSSEKE